MKDYHVFSSENLVDWTDHGAIIDQKDVDWVDPNGNAMWAPDAIERNGTYYFYFPAIADTNEGFRGRRIGVATSGTPHGPFTPQTEPIEGVYGIDPNTFIDKDGQAYLYWSGRGIWGAKLNSDMLEIESDPIRLDEEHPQSGLREGPFMFERNGLYYLTYPRVIENTEALVYSTGDNPFGPFEYQGIFMDEHESGCWTNHHSIVKYEDQWYLFYHHNDYSPDFDKNRSIRVDSLFFNPDGTIKKVMPTLRGVGLTDATSKIQIDRYTQLSENGASIAFIDPSNTFKGWKTVLSEENAWVQYNRVDFGRENLKRVEILAHAETAGTIEIHLNSVDGPTIAKIDIPVSDTLEVSEAPLHSFKLGIQNLFVVFNNNSLIEIDWIRFK
jgi:hypothetical protein